MTLKVVGVEVKQSGEAPEHEVNHSELDEGF
jgi:hypothetical protein